MRSISLPNHCISTHICWGDFCVPNVLRKKYEVCTLQLKGNYDTTELVLYMQYQDL